MSDTAPSHRAMPICVSRYPCWLRTRSEPAQYDPETSVAVVEEEREPDEWGQPGRLVHRKLLYVEGPFGGTWANHHRSRHSSWRLELGPRIGRLHWASPARD